MEKLVDVFGTKYFTYNWARKISRYLDDHKEVDIAGARLVKRSVDELTSAIERGAYVIDSEDHRRNALLEENRRRAKLSYRTQRLPRIASVSEFNQYIRTLSEDVVYEPDGDFKLSIPLAVLIQCVKPRVKFDFGNVYRKVFEYIVLKLYPNPHKWTKFNMLVGSTFTEVEVEDGCIYIPLKGMVPLDEVMQSELLIPIEFGREYLENKPEWDDFIYKVVADIEGQIGLGNSIKDFISLEEV